MKCAICGRETEPIHIDGQDFCSNCGNLYQKPPASSAPVSDAAATPTPRNFDLSPRRTQTPAPAPAAALHHRSSSRHVIDLRPAPAAPAPAPVSAAISHHPSRHLDGRASHADPTTTTDPAFTSRMAAAKRTPRSSVINRFIGGRLPEPAPTEPAAGTSAPAATASAPVPKPAPRPLAIQPPPRPAPKPAAPAVLPAKTVTQHAALKQLAATAPKPPEPAPATKPAAAPKRPGPSLNPHHKRLAATTAVVVIMAGYIWLQNYPKLAIQTADQRAGISATMPGFMPSSYALANTASQPGAITLKFTSPSTPVALTIAQQRTSWDARSLLDNYVASAADDYASVNGQGLTIYLFGNNNATWVNHGIWYSIQGASQLSRDQILKIAYSL